VLVKWDGSSWIQLETKVLSKDDTNTYLEGKTNSFSPFAITAKLAASNPTVIGTPVPAGSPTPAGTTTPAPAEESSIMTWIIGLIILVIIGAAVYFLVVKKNE